jgi:hypothetical protein
MRALFVTSGDGLTEVALFLISLFALKKELIITM